MSEQAKGEQAGERTMSETMNVNEAMGDLAAHWRFLSRVERQAPAVIERALGELGISREQYDTDMAKACLFGAVAQRVSEQL